MILAATLAIFFGGVSDAAEIRGRVVRISDGDTLTILSPAAGTTGVPPVGEAITGTTGVPPVGEAITGTTGVPPVGGAITGTTGVSPVAQHKIRLYGIDAPESHQTFGQKSKHHLSSPAYAAAETEARQNRRGLWSDHNPIPPEQYRHGRAGAPRTPSAATQTAAPSNEITLPASRVEYRAGNAMLVGSRTPAPVCDTWPDTGYWLSTNSNKRHNRKCENYRKTQGYPCSSSDGTPCGKCRG